MRFLDLVAIEWLKTRRRAGFWLALLFFFGILITGLGTSYYEHVRNPSTRAQLPQWNELGGFLQAFGFMVMLVTIVLLTAAEKTWRTERQNVIDGLSRTQYFAAKAIVVVGFALLLWLGTLIVGGVFEVLERSLASAPGPILPARHMPFLGGLLLYLVMVGAVALLFASVASGSGAALALVFLFLLTQPFFAAWMAHKGGALHRATSYLPMQVLGSLSNPLAYDASNFATLQTRLAGSGNPLNLPAAQAMLVALVYIVLFGAGAWLSIRLRDL